MESTSILSPNRGDPNLFATKQGRPNWGFLLERDRIPKALPWAAIELALRAEGNIRLMYKRQVPAFAGMT
jgi:hypothetical protein